MEEKKKVAIFDIDGTIFRSSLLIELTDALIQEGIFSKETKESYQEAYNNWLNRSGSYDNYIHAVITAFIENIKGVKYDDFLEISKKVISFHGNRVYKYSRDFIEELKKKNYYLLAISHSPKILVEEFCEKMGFDKSYGRILEIDNQKKLTGEVLYLDFIEDKAEVLRRAIEKEKLSLKESIGMGDTESDIPFLEIVERPICFNPNQKLYDHAKEKGWEVVVERKDVIYLNSNI